MHLKRFSSLGKLAAGAMAFSLLLASVASAAAGRVTKDSHVLNTSGEKSKKVCSVKTDDSVEVTAKSGDFYKIKTADGKTGYLPKECIELSNTKKASTNYVVKSSGSDEIDTLLKLINDARKAKGIDPLSFDSRLLKGAKTRAAEVLQEYSHTRPDGNSWQTIFPELKMEPVCISENVAGGYKTAQEVFDGWHSSALHKKNMLNPDYKYIGLGKATGDGAKYDIGWVAIFCS